MQFKTILAAASLLGVSLAAPRSASVISSSRARKPCRPASADVSSIDTSSSSGSSYAYTTSSSNVPSILDGYITSSISATSSSSSGTESSSATFMPSLISSSSAASSSTSLTSVAAAPESSSTAVSSTTSDVSSTATDYPIPTPGVEMPTRTYTGSISSFSTGTPVAIQNPSFESAGPAGESPQKRSVKRQSAAQVVEAAEGWTVQSCGTSETSDCQFENYDAADGTWAFSGKRGGLLYQDGVNLAAGGSYAFTFYWKVVSTYDGADSSSTGNQVTQSVYLGSNANPDVTKSFVPTVGSSTVESGADWVQQTFTLSLSCQYANFATAVRPDGSLDFRMFLEGKTASGTVGDFLWYVDDIRVQQLSPPAGGTLAYLTNTCKITPPASTTSSATSTYTVTQTYDTATTPTAGTNVLGNPSFESTSITETTDVNGFPLKARDWTSTGCAGRQCQLYASGSGNVICQDGSRCQYWRAATTYSRTLSVNIGATYFLSIWTLLGSVPTDAKTGSSVVRMTIAAPGAAPGGGGLVLSAENNAITNNWAENTKMLDLDAEFAQQLCGAADGDTTATCQITLSAEYTGSWNATDNLLNYFDNVSFFEVQ